MFKKVIQICEANLKLVSNKKELLRFKKGVIADIETDFYKVRELRVSPRGVDAYFYMIDEDSQPRVHISSDTIIAQGNLLELEKRAKDLRFSLLGNEGLFENDGTPDQTFDVVEMKGVSSYCGGLWLASLKAAAVMAEILGDLESKKRYDELYTRGQWRFEELLWTGEYFKVDTSGPYSDCIFIGQLIGQWFARLCNLGNIVDSNKARLALKKIYQTNFNNFRKGTLGALTMMDTNGNPVIGKIQCGEIMTGINMLLPQTCFNTA